MRACVLILAAAFLWTEALAHDVIVRQNVRVHESPDSASPTLFTLLPGDEARLLETQHQNGYLHVFHKLGNGWAFARRVEVLPDYERTEYRHWIDEDEDRCDTRAEVLIEESEILVTLEEDKPCNVIAGRWTDPYSGEVITDPSDLDVDHMVPLRNAHRRGLALDISTPPKLRQRPHPPGTPDSRKRLPQSQQGRQGAGPMASP